MLKIVLIFLQLIVGIFVAFWLLKHPGTVCIDWLDYHIQLSLALFVTILCGASIFSILSFKLIKAFFSIPGHFYKRYLSYNHKKALASLTAAISAYENGDWVYAWETLDSALKEPELKPLALFVRALIAQEQSKNLEAQQYFKELTGFSETKTLGYKGLIILKRLDGGSQEAIEYARQALPFITHAPKLAAEVFDIFLSGSLWNEAEQALKKMAYSKALSKERWNSLYSKLSSAKAQSALAINEIDLALSEARKAYEICPTFDSTLLYARLLITQKCFHQARKLLEKAWHKTPHQEILDLYFFTYEIPPNPLEKYQIVEKLSQQNGSHSQVLLLRAKAAIEAELWGIALSYLQLYQSQYSETQEFIKIMIEYEQQANHDLEAALRWSIKLNEIYSRHEGTS
jgi:HemY protein